MINLKAIRTIGLAMLLSLSALSHASLVTSTLNGVTIGGTSYDVTFTQDSDGLNSFNDLFGVGSSPTLTFTSSGDALAAVAAVVAAANSSSFDVSPGGWGNGFGLAYALDASAFSYVTAFAGSNNTFGPFTASRDSQLGGAFVTFAVSQVPEPGSLALVAVAMVTALTRSRRRRR